MGFYELRFGLTNHINLHLERNLRRPFDDDWHRLQCNLGSPLVDCWYHLKCDLRSLFRDDASQYRLAGRVEVHVKAGLWRLVMRFLLPVLLLLAGCASPGTITFPVIPTYVQAADTRVFSLELVQQGVAKKYPGIAVDFVDDFYSVVSYDYLTTFTDWEWRAIQIDGIFYTPESFDCDDFALGYEFLFHVSAGLSHLKTSPLLVRVKVILPDGTLHMLNGAFTDKGEFLIEPQSTAGAFRIMKLSDFKGTILGIYL